MTRAEALCCWCDARGTFVLVYRDGWRDPACAVHAVAYSKGPDILEAAFADASARERGSE